MDRPAAMARPWPLSEDVSLQQLPAKDRRKVSDFVLDFNRFVDRVPPNDLHVYHFSDIANGIAQGRDFWLDDAFASGGRCRTAGFST